MKKTETFTVTAENIAQESYYNLIQVAKITGYANPEKAFKDTCETLTVKKDHLGNIISKA